MLFAPLPQELRHTTFKPGKYAALLGWSLRFADLAVLACAGLLAWRLRFGHFEMSLDYQRHVAMATLLALPVLSLSRIYRSWRGKGLFAELPAMAGAFALIFGLTVLYAVAFKLPINISRLWWLMWMGGTIAGGALSRYGARRIAAFVRENDMDVRSAVIVGSTGDAQRIVEALKLQRSAGIRVRGWFDVWGQGGAIPDAQWLGNVEALGAFVDIHHVDQVWVALPMSAERDIARILELLHHSTADIKFVPDLLGLQLLNHSVEQVAGLPVINLRASPFDGDARLVKAIEDRVLATLILLLIAPVLAVVALGVKLTSPGPVLFRQRRHGLGGKVIEVWKFRSMRVHQEAQGQVTQATKHDARVTPFGRFLRRTSLDELPQFFNVLQGTMSIVGPRPHAVAHNHQFKDQVTLYMQRHRVKPGITGWAQVNGLRGETDTVAKMAMRVEHDLFYLQNWSLWMDLRIVVMTLWRGFVASGAY